MNPQDIIQRILSDYLVAGKAYPRPLPTELQPWYCYTSDGGHSIVAAIKSLYALEKPPESFLVPVPVKTVLRGYEPDHGYIVVNLPYDGQVGLVTPRGDDEY